LGPGNLNPNPNCLNPNPNGLNPNPRRRVHAHNNFLSVNPRIRI